MMSHSFATVLLPFSADKVGAVNAYLDDCKTPLKLDLCERIKPLGCVHFMSITVIEDTDLPVDDPARQDAYLAIEITSDRDAPTTLHLVAKALEQELRALFEKATLDLLDAPIDTFLIRHNHGIGQCVFSPRMLGLTFSGSPGMTVARIRFEQKLAEWIGRDQADVLAGHGTALDKLRRVRNALWDKGDDKQAFFAEPVPWVGWQRGSTISIVLRTFLSMAAKLFWPLLILGVGGTVYAAWLGRIWALTAVPADSARWVTWLLAYLGGAGACVGFIILFFVLAILAGAAAADLLQYEEGRDNPEDAPPDADQVGDVMTRENFYAQNLLATVSPMKEGRFRRFTLRFAFAAIGGLSSTLYMPGFLSGIGVIHFARWVLLPNAKDKNKPGRLLFWSNYDGSLESYLEDFIERAHEGVTGIWSNTRNFPKARFLFTEGAKDGDRLRRSVLRSQNVVRFWYSAYPDLTMSRIRTNALIRHGIATARTEDDAARWLACFGSANAAGNGTSASATSETWHIRRFSSWLSKPSIPFQKLELDQIPSLALGGMSRLRCGVLLAVALGEEQHAQDMLKQIAKLVTYGSVGKEKTSALAVGLAASALERIGLPEDDRATFPPAFLNGMTAPWRSRALGDTGCNDPEHWKWGHGATAVDMVLLVYAEDQDKLQKKVSCFEAILKDTSSRLVAKLPMEDLGERNGDDKRSQMVEPFGFADGISQPGIHGGPKNSKPTAEQDLIEAGEIILGYRDNLGYLPSSPSIVKAHNRDNRLPDSPDGARARCDLGRNGTFLVIRQLHQHLPGFKTWFSEAANCVQKKETGLGKLSPDKFELLKAKLVGRWTNGTPLPLHPSAPGFKTGTNFIYGPTDPSGQVCPLGAHMRRANPRDSLDPGSQIQLKITNRHRILRVGRIYNFPKSCFKPYNKPEAPYTGKPGEKGLLFMCVNADIGRQFEFVQQTWLLGANFHGLENEVDPIIGVRSPANGVHPTSYFTIPTPQGPVRLKLSEKPLVQVRGGGYFFMASKDTLNILANAGWTG